MPGNSHGGRRSALSAGATAVVLSVVGAAALGVGIRGTDGPPQPAAAVQPTATVQPTASPTPRRLPTEPATPATRTARPASPVTTAQRGQPQLTVSKRTRPKAKTTKRARADIGPFLPPSKPTILEIPSIGVRSKSFVGLQVAKDGTLEAPRSADDIGFYTGGVTPGQLGPAVMGAHVDSADGPGLFYSLGAVRAGDKIHVTRRDGIMATFVVDEVAVYPKDQFPTDKVYYSGLTSAQLRLVTCGGTYDPAKHYLDNVIVFAHLTNAR